MSGKIIGIVGMPGSGKTTLMSLFRKDSKCWQFDDINTDWDNNITQIKTLMSFQDDINVIVSDILFCRESFRHKFEKEVGKKVQWIFFENDVERARKNVFSRNRDQCVETELKMIDDLSKTFFPTPIKIF